MSDKAYISQASELWTVGRAFEAGRMLYERLPSASRPLWAARALQFAASRTQVPSSASQILDLLKLAERPEHWQDAKRLFSALRQFALQLERLPQRSPEESSLLRLFYLAENVAKVIYNATDPADEFDEDAGYWVVKCLDACLQDFGEGKSRDKAWQILIEDSRS